MTIAKKTATKKAAPKRAGHRFTVRQRAALIIADVKGYDPNTRAAIYNALEEEDDDLAEIVRRAESGEMILDIPAPDYKLRERAERIINSDEYTSADRVIVQVLLEHNSPKLAEIVDGIEKGEGVAAKLEAEAAKRDQDREDGKSLTCEQARAYGTHLGMMLGNNSSIADALLVFRALTHSDNRDSLCNALTGGIMPMATPFDRAVRELVLEAADEWDRHYPPTKGGAE